MSEKEKQSGSTESKNQRGLVGVQPPVSLFDARVAEASEWLRGTRSMCNLIPQHPLETWEVRIAEADAAKIQQAYWILKAHKEGLMR